MRAAELVRPHVEVRAPEGVVFRGASAALTVVVRGWGWVSLYRFGDGWTRRRWFAGDRTLEFIVPSDTPLRVRAVNAFGFVTVEALLVGTHDAPLVELARPEPPDLPDPVVLPVPTFELPAPVDLPAPAVALPPPQVVLAPPEIHLPRVNHVLR